MNTLLTRGLRNRSVDGLDWYTLMTRAIQGEWPSPDAAVRTLEAERELGIVGHPYYFYVLRAEDSYSLAVFVLSEAEDVVWPPAAKGATPFDSGGWWLGKIHTEPRLDPAARQAAFQALDVWLGDWKGEFEQYIRANYGTVEEYIEGRVPSSGCRPPKTEFTILRGSPNTSKAWTWEVRVPHNLIADRLTPKAVYITETHRDDYVYWLLRESQLPDRTTLGIHRWISDHAIVPDHNESVVQAAQESLVSEAARG